MSYCIRSARPDEAAAVADLAVETFPMACPPSLSAHDMHAYIDEHLTAQRFAEHIAHPERDVLVACDDTHLLGYVLLFFSPDGAPAPDMGVTLATSGLLSKCYVRREGHGKGAAAALLEAAERRAGERGVQGLWLNVNYDNHRAQRFYAKHGWECVGCVDFVVGQAVHHDPVYQKRVAASAP